MSPTFIVLALLVLICTCHSKSFHGGTFLAMAGKDCVVIASDSRFTSQEEATGPYLVGEHQRVAFRVGDSTLVGCYGLDSDSRRLAEAVQAKLHKISSPDSSSISSSERTPYRHHHIISPQSVARLISNTLYSSNLMCAPVVVGLGRSGHAGDAEGRSKEPSNCSVSTPYICCLDGLGAMTVTDKFAVTGTANHALYAICESYFQSELSAGDLVSLTEKCIKLGLQRDILSGCNVRIYLITADGMYTRDIVTFDV